MKFIIAFYFPLPITRVFEPQLYLQNHHLQLHALSKYRVIGIYDMKSKGMSTMFLFIGIHLQNVILSFLVGIRKVDTEK